MKQNARSANPLFKVVGACIEVSSTQRPRLCIRPRLRPDSQAVGPDHPRSCGKAGGGRSEVYCDEEEPVLEEVSKEAGHGVDAWNIT